MIDHFSFGGWEPRTRYWLVYNYENGRHPDVIMWSNKFQRLFNEWVCKNTDCFNYENGKAPYGIACNIAAF